MTIAPVEPPEAGTIELSILMPCLNEAETLETCVRKALQALADANISGEVIVADNGMYGTIRMHQERHYPGRVVGTGLKNPDFAAYARAFGGYGATVEKTADFLPAFEAAQKSGKPAILHLKVDPEALTPTMSLTATREKAQAGA